MLHITLIKINYICPFILCFREITSWINIIIFRLILIIFLYFKVSQRMRRHQKSWPVLIPPSLAWIATLPANIFPNKQALNAAVNVSKNSSFCSHTLFSMVPLTNQIWENELFFWYHLFLHLKILVLFLNQTFSFKQLHVFLTLLPVILMVPKNF